MKFLRADKNVNSSIGASDRTDTANFTTRTTPTTFAKLPAAVAAGAGARAYITDGSTATFGATVAGGGSNAVPVYSDGTNWRVG